MTPVAELRPRVATEVPNCPNPVIDRALVDAARALCSGASIWRDTLAVTPDGHGTRIALQSSGVTVNGQPAAASWPDSAELARVIPPGVEVSGRDFRQYEMVDQRTLHVLRDPGDELTVHVSLRPTLAARSLPDAVTLDYLEGVVSGALSRVLRMTSEPWTNPQMAQYYAREARQARNQAVIEAQRGFEGGAMRVKPRLFATFGSRR